MAQQGEVKTDYRLVSWNVENFFDIDNDPQCNDDAFTPDGQNRWIYSRYQKKLLNIVKTIVAISDGNESSMPLCIGLVEVENDKVLRDLCFATPLRKYNYDFIHFDSPDARGIDNALLFRRELYSPFFRQSINVSDSSKRFFTRDILLVEGVTTTGDTIIVLVNHFPSRQGGGTATRRRSQVAAKLRIVADTVSQAHPSASLVIMGDFNAEPSERDISKTLINPESGSHFCLKSLMDNIPPGRGSYFYRGQWSCIDQIIVGCTLAQPNSLCTLALVSDTASIFSPPFLLTHDEKFMTDKPLRTYLGLRYVGGFSDHLPVFVDLRKK